VIDPEVLLGVAREAAAVAAAELSSRVGKVSVLRAKSSPTDPVTEADEAAERAVRDLLASQRPDDAIVGEEGGEAGGSSGLRWIIDPLDGTVNYLYGHPQWCVSVAVEDTQGPVAGVVLDVLRGEEFSAIRGSEPMLNRHPFTRSGVHSAGGDDPLAGALLATGFHYEAEVRAKQAEVFSSLIPRLRDIRRGGSAALDLCWAAIGRVDAYTELGVREWDVAAGGLVCLCAGLDVAVLAADSVRPQGIIAAETEVLGALAAEWGMGSAMPWPQTRIS
jgi:myo-inositol-1(or 4)-monophosphatase